MICRLFEKSAWIVFFIVFFSVIFSSSSFELLAQLTVVPQNSPSVIYNLASNGITITNVVIECENEAMGTFNASQTNLGLSDGVIMTTGKATVAIGHPTQGNNLPDAYYRYRFNQPDNDLANELGITPDKTDDVCRLTFKIKSITNKILFKYVFGSEEYNEWIGTPYNDAFAFFVSGPGYSPQKNVALVPNTQNRVSISNINGNINSQYYRDNFNCKNSQCIEYDGFSEILTAEINVIPNTEYTIKLAICDVNDDRFDSGVFIKSILASEDPLNYDDRKPTIYWADQFESIINEIQNNRESKTFQIQNDIQWKISHKDINSFYLLKTLDFKNFDTIYYTINQVYREADSVVRFGIKTSIPINLPIKRIYYQLRTLDNQWLSRWSEVPIPDNLLYPISFNEFRDTPKIFPNPSEKGKLGILFPLDRYLPKDDFEILDRYFPNSIYIRDIMGRTITENILNREAIRLLASDPYLEIEIKDLPKGIYCVTLSYNSGETRSLIWINSQN